MNTTLKNTLLLGGALLASSAHAQGPNPLVTGKAITPPIHAIRQNVGSLPMNMILAPGGRYAVSTDMGFRQSLWVIDTQTGHGVSHLDFPNGGTTDPRKTNGLYYGLAAAPNAGGGSTVYAAQGENGTIAVLTLSAGGILTDTGRRITTTRSGEFPAGIALDGRGNLYVAMNEVYNVGNPLGVDPAAGTMPSSLIVFDTLTGAEKSRTLFNELSIGSGSFTPNPALPASLRALLPTLNGPLQPPSFPLSVAATSDGSRVYVTSQRDGKVYVLDATNPLAPSLTKTVLTGAHPDSLLLTSDGSRLYVANAHSDTVSVLRTADSTITGTLFLRPSGTDNLPGATPTGLALSPDESTLYVTLGDMNAIAVCDTAALTRRGYIPAGWYPTGVVVSPDNSRLLVTDAKGTQTRNPNKVAQGTGGANGTYILNIIEGNVLTFPIPSTTLLTAQTQQVMDNNHITANTSNPVNPLAGINLAAGGIKHVIYIVKENRTYDQVLGDLPQGNGDPSLTLFGANVTPNLHALASRFVLLDNFYDCGEASGDGWPWSTNSFATEYVIKNLPYNYSGRGRNYDFEGSNNFYPTGGFPATDTDGNILSTLFLPTPGSSGGAPPIPDVAEGPNGHIWDDVQRNVNLTGTGLTNKYRNYGFFYSLAFPTNGGLPPPLLPFPDNYPASAGVQPPGHDGAGISDYDFREFDLTYPDSDAPFLQGAQANYKTASYSHYTRQQLTPTSLGGGGKTPARSRFQEFQKEFTEMAVDPTGNSVPAFMTVRFMSDHTDGTTAGDPSPRAHVADNDYAVGQLVNLVSQYPNVWNHTAIFVIEDDAQDGQDHVDAHRSPCYVISPYIKQSVVDHTFYNTDSVLKTMEQLLGIPPLSQYDATANTIMDFDTAPNNNGVYAATLPDASIIGQVNPAVMSLKPGTMAYHLARLAAKMDFKHPDSADPTLLNEMIWKSVKGMKSKMPASRHTVIPVRTPASPAATARQDSDD